MQRRCVTACLRRADVPCNSSDELIHGISTITLKAARREARRSQRSGCLSAIHAAADLEAMTPATNASAEDKVLQTIGAPLDMPSKVSAHSLSPSPGGSRPRYGRAHLLQPSPAAHAAAGAVQQEASAATMCAHSTDGFSGTPLLREHSRARTAR